MTISSPNLSQKTPDFIYSTEGTTNSFFKKLAPVVFKEISASARWVYRNILRQTLSQSEGTDMAMTALFEARVKCPAVSDNELVEEAIKVYRSYLWAKGTPAYEAMRMMQGGKTREKNYAELVSTMPWGEELRNRDTPIDLSYSTDSSITVGNIFVQLEEQLGTEIALIYTLHHAYDWSVSKIVKYVLGKTPTTDPTGFSREHKRLLRLLGDLGGLIKINHASRKDP